MKFLDKKLLIFDFDGTLIDSVPDLALAVNHMLEAVGRPTFKEEEIRVWIGNGAQTLVKRALSAKSEVDDSLDEAVFEKALDIFLKFYAKNLCNQTKTYVHVSTTLNTLKKKGYRLAIVTNKPYDFIEPILRGLELDGLFELSVGGDSLKNKKPHPEPLLYVCKELGVEVLNAVMIGDSKNDILAAHGAGMESVGVTYGYNYAENINVYKPNVVIDDFAKLIKSFT